MTLATLADRRRYVLLGSLAALALALTWVVSASRASCPGAAASASPCVPALSKPFRSPAYATTPWPSEHADVWRTHAAPTGLPSNIDEVRLVAKSSQLPLEPAWGYVGTGRRIYVVG